ncbi:MAG: hypothetical protein A2157_19000 [Deltaproteobacteria bacterium RBG_16_47_11]|nr:MAG: hypothetical protein A2157_19000 [Deltaproteobacteria bacterium RBG_16_47_11]
MSFSLPIRATGSHVPPKSLAAVNFSRFMGLALFQQVMGYLIEWFPRVGGAYPFDAYRLTFLFCVGSLLLGTLVYGFVEDTYVGSSCSD